MYYRIVNELPNAMLVMKNSRMGHESYRSRYSGSLQAGRFEVQTPLGARGFLFCICIQIGSWTHLASSTMSTVLLYQG